MKYICTLCNYESDRKFSYKRHLNSDKHEHKVQKEQEEQEEQEKEQLALKQPEVCRNQNINYICHYCQSVFTKASSLSKHRKICEEKLKHNTLHENKIELLENEIELLKNEIETLKKHGQDQIKSLKKENNKLNKELEYFKELFREITKSNKSSPSTITYVLNNYRSTSSLLYLDDYLQLNDNKNMDLKY